MANLASPTFSGFTLLAYDPGKSALLQPIDPQVPPPSSSLEVSKLLRQAWPYLLFVCDLNGTPTLTFWQWPLDIPAILYTTLPNIPLPLRSMQIQIIAEEELGDLETLRSVPISSPPLAHSVTSTAAPPPPPPPPSSLLIWIPARGTLPESCVAATHIVSLYYAGKACFIELTNGKTIELNYDAAATAVAAWRAFRKTMDSGTGCPARAALEAEYPRPVNGSIRKFV